MQTRRRTAVAWPGDPRPPLAVPARAAPLAVPAPPRGTVRSPRCTIGFADALRTESLVVSLHCAATRARFRRTGAGLKADLLSGECRIVLTHCARTAREVPVAVELLRLSEADYPVALMGALALAAALDADLTVADIRLLVKEGGFAVEADAQEEDALALAVIAARRAYRRGPPA